MSLQTVSISRGRVLGTLNNRCDQVELVPVFLSTDMDTQIGFADQGLGRYADAFSFHLPPEMCKKLSTGQFSFSFGYAHEKATEQNRKPRITLTYICLTTFKPVI